MLKKGMYVLVVLVAGVWAGVCGPANAGVWLAREAFFESVWRSGREELRTVLGGRGLYSTGTEVSFGIGGAGVRPGANGPATRFSVVQYLGFRPGRKVVPYVLWGGGGVAPMYPEHNYSYEELGAGVRVSLEEGLGMRIGVSRVSGKFHQPPGPFPTSIGLSVAVQGRVMRW